MGFAQEIKDFVSGFTAGYKMIHDPSEKERERAELKAAQDKAEKEGGADVGIRRSGLGAADRFVTGGDDSTGRASRGRSGSGENKSYIDTPVDVDDEGMKAILEIARRDSGQNGYNALTYKRGGGSGGTAPLTDMTLGQVYELQRKMPSMGHASTAVGGYQFVHDTLKGAADALNLSPDAKFTPKVQDMLAAQLVKNRGYDAWKAGKLPTESFQRNLSREWAILPRDVSGRGSYDGYNGNRAGVSHSTLMSAFDVARGKTAAPGIKTEQVKTYTGPDYSRSEGLKGRKASEVTQASTDEDYFKEDDELLSFTKGGLVPHYQSGGMVEEEDAPLPPTRPAGIRIPGDVPDNAPVRTAAPRPDAGRESFREDAGTRGAPIEFSPKDFTSLELVGEAAHEGLMGIQSIFGFDKPGVRDPDKLRAFARNEGKATPDEIKAVDQAIGADRLSAEEKNIARLNAGYKFYRDRGEPLKARQYAASMLMAANDTVRNLGALAEVAIRNGDYAGAAKAVAAGKSAVPDGENVRVTGKPSKDGVSFEVFDSEGKVTERGKASIDDLMQVATGMQNGTLFFEQAGLIKQKTARERILEKREKSLRAYEETGPQSEYRERFIDTLTDEQRNAFLNLNPSDQKQKIAEWERGLSASEKEAAQQAGRDERMGREVRMREEREGKRAQAQDNFETRRRDQAAGAALRQRNVERGFGIREKGQAGTQERFEERQAYRIKRDEVLDGRWAQKREQEMTREEAQLAQRMLEEDGRNRRHDLTLEQRNMLQAKYDLRAMNKLRGGGGGAGGGGRLTAGERGAAQAEVAGAAERTAIANDPAEYADIGPEVGGEPQQGPTLGISRRLAASDAGTAWERQVKLAPNRFKQENIAAIDNELDQLAQRAGLKEGLPQREKFLYRSIATDIMKGNDVGGDQAAVIAAAIAQKPEDIKVMPDGRVQVDPNIPPVFVSKQALAQIAAIMSSRQQPVTREDNPKPGIRSPYLLPDPRARAAPPRFGPVEDLR